jgi:hypothetical protein
VLVAEFTQDPVILATPIPIIVPLSLAEGTFILPLEDQRCGSLSSGEQFQILNQAELNQINDFDAQPTYFLRIYRLTSDRIRNYHNYTQANRKGCCAV